MKSERWWVVGIVGTIVTLLALFEGWTRGRPWLKEHRQEDREEAAEKRFSTHTWQYDGLAMAF